MDEWSPFRRALGHFFHECGVHGGCVGHIFDFSVKQVEDLAMNGADIIQDDERKPLLAFGVASCWVLQTLAQHTEDEADDSSNSWIELTNEVASLVHLAASAPECEETLPLIKEMLFSLVAVYESLRQNEDNGYIYQQLQYKYEKV